MIYSNMLARIVTQLERSRVCDLWDAGTPIADEVQSMADEIAEATAYAAELDEDMDGITETCMEVLTGPDVPCSAAGKVREVVERLKLSEGVPTENLDVNELTVGWTADLDAE
jgi:hypothetical protein